MYFDPSHNTTTPQQQHVDSEAILSGAAHVSVSAVQPNLPPTDYVYATGDLLGTDTALLGVKAHESGPVDGVRTTVVVVCEGGHGHCVFFWKGPFRDISKLVLVIEKNSFFLFVSFVS